jgi:hypothetical protein
MSQPEHKLHGGFLNTSVVRFSDSVRRAAGYWSPAVHAWLDHLHKLGLTVASVPLRLDSSRNEEWLTHIDGLVASGGFSEPWLWADNVLVTIATLIRRFHDATAGFSLPSGVGWNLDAGFGEGGDVICHNDLAPWNTVYADHQPIAFIDWDLAAPGPRWWDVAYAMWHFIPLYGTPDSDDPFDLSQLGPRARRARLFCDAYGLLERAELVDQIIERQQAVHALFERKAAQGDPSYQRLWNAGAGDGILRQVKFVRSHASELLNAVTAE